MDREDLKKYIIFNEENLNFIQRIRLQTLTKRNNNDMVIKIANINFEHLDDAEKIYLSKYLSDYYSFYMSSSNKIYIAPQNSSLDKLTEFGINEPTEEIKRNQLYNELGLGIRNLRTYSIVPGVKYKLMKGKSLTGYASVDKPWNLLNQQINIKENDLLDFYNNSRKFLGPKKCKYAFQCYDQKVTWEEFEKMVDTYRKSLTECGVKENDVVPICVTSNVESIALYFAIDSLGATTFFIDPVETNSDTINKYLTRFDAKLVFADCKNLDKIKSSLNAKDTKIVVMSPTDSMKNTDNLSNESKEYIKNYNIPFNEDDKTVSLSTFTNLGKLSNNDIKKCKNNDHISLITSTSASTGEPKLVELTRRNIMCELEQIKKTTNIHLGPNGINMQVVPFKYPYGFVVSTLISPYVGKTSGLTPDFSLSNYHKFIFMYEPAYIHLIPSLMMHMQTNHEFDDKDMSYLKYIICGGDAFESGKKAKANEWLKQHNSSAKVKDASGAAEVTAGQTASTVGKYNIETVGKPMIGTTIKIVNDLGEELPYGNVGKIWYSGENVMNGYVDDIDKTNEVKYTDPDGVTWVKTDSYGFIDAEGFVYMCGRDRDFYITYPKNKPPFKVYTQNVESVINSFDDVVDCVVVKQPNDEMFLSPKAYIVLKNSVMPSQYNEILNKLKILCETKLDDCAVPLSFEIVSELKTKPSKKVDRDFYIKEAEKEYENSKNNGVKSL